MTMSDQEDQAVHSTHSLLFKATSWKVPCLHAHEATVAVVVGRHAPAVGMGAGTTKQTEFQQGVCRLPGVMLRFLSGSNSVFS